MFIIDFDDTLFNTRPGFRAARIFALKQLGVLEELYDKTYLEARNSLTGELIYDNKHHAMVLAKYGFNETEVLLALNKTCEPTELERHLFPDARFFLESLKKFNEPLVLLSLGQEEYQYLKVKNLGIARYFDRIFFVSYAKEKIFDEIIKNVSDKDIWFINDKINETQTIIAKYPFIKAVLKHSLAGTLDRYKESGLSNFSTLTEIYNYVKKHQ